MSGRRSLMFTCVPQDVKVHFEKADYLGELTIKEVNVFSPAANSIEGIFYVFTSLAS